jgi:hypothetical protein
MVTYPQSLQEAFDRRGVPPEEQARLRGLLAEQIRALPEQVAVYALVRAMAGLLASPLRCDVCECHCFVGLAGTAEDTGPICPVCDPAAATAYLQSPKRLVRA